MYFIFLLIVHSLLVALVCLCLCVSASLCTCAFFFFFDFWLCMCARECRLQENDPGQSLVICSVVIFLGSGFHSYSCWFLFVSVLILFHVSCICSHIN